jgi:hypothetical protein
MPSHEADVFQGAHTHQFQRISCGGHEAILDATRGADEKNLCGVVFLEFVSNGQSRDDVSAGASSRQDCAHVVTINYKKTGQGLRICAKKTFRVSLTFHFKV